MKLFSDSSNRTLEPFTPYLQVDQFLTTIRRATDLAHQIDWTMLDEPNHHNKVVDMCQLVINDLFVVLSRPSKSVQAVVHDFMATFYPDKEHSVSSTRQVKFALPGPAHRQPGIVGKGIFENISSDLALIKPGLEQSHGQSLADVKQLCVQVYRSTNQRYQEIARQILQQKGLPLQHASFRIDSYLSLAVIKLKVNGQDLLLVDTDHGVSVVDAVSLELLSVVGIKESMRCAVQTADSVWIGCTNGLLIKTDLQFEVVMLVKLKKHIFSILVVDDCLLCGEMNGWLELVRATDGAVVCSERFKHCGNIVGVQSGPQVTVIATEKGVWFVKAGREQQQIVKPATPPIASEMQSAAIKPMTAANTPKKDLQPKQAARISSMTVNKLQPVGLSVMKSANIQRATVQSSPQKQRPLESKSPGGNRHLHHHHETQETPRKIISPPKTKAPPIKPVLNLKPKQIAIKPVIAILPAPPIQIKIELPIEVTEATYKIELLDHYLAEDIRFVKHYQNNTYIAGTSTDVTLFERHTSTKQQLKLANPLGTQPLSHPDLQMFFFVITQTQLVLCDFRRMQSFQLMQWEYKATPQNSSLIEVIPCAQGLGIVSIEFDGSHSTIQRLLVNSDTVQAITFLAQD